MNGYMISTQDAPGIAARLLEATAARGVNAFPFYGLGDGTTGIFLIGSDDEDGLRGAMADAGLHASALEMVTVELENRPGTGAEIFRKSTFARPCRSGWARTACSWPLPPTMRPP